MDWIHISTWISITDGISSHPSRSWTGQIEDILQVRSPQIGRATRMEKIFCGNIRSIVEHLLAVFSGLRGASEHEWGRIDTLTFDTKILQCSTRSNTWKHTQWDRLFFQAIAYLWIVHVLSRMVKLKLVHVAFLKRTSFLSWVIPVHIHTYNLTLDALIVEE